MPSAIEKLPYRLPSLSSGYKDEKCEPAEKSHRVISKCRLGEGRNRAAGILFSAMAAVKLQEFAVSNPGRRDAPGEMHSATLRTGARHTGESVRLQDDEGVARVTQ